MSLAVEICRLAAGRLEPAQLGRLVTVGLEVGDQAGVEASNLAFCLETLLAQPPFGVARPVIERSAGDALRVTYLEVDDGRPED